MKRIMFIGATGAGKSTLIRELAVKLELDSYIPRRAMALQYHGPFVNTPGEFLENRRFYNALITTGAESSMVVMVQDSTAPSSLFPPTFASAFNRPVLGVATKMDELTAIRSRAVRFLENAGVGNVVCVSARTGEGLGSLLVRLALLPASR